MCSIRHLSAPDANVNKPSDNHRQQPPLFTAHRQPVPGLPSAFTMNPGGYPMNGSPFTTHPPSHSPYPQPPQNSGGQGPTSPTDSHGGHRYAYPGYSYSGHSYPQYPQYPQPIMMYAPPRQHGGPEPTHASPPPVHQQPSSVSSNKRKSLSFFIVCGVHDF